MTGPADTRREAEPAVQGRTRRISAIPPGPAGVRRRGLVGRPGRAARDARVAPRTGGRADRTAYPGGPDGTDADHRLRPARPSAEGGGRGGCTGRKLCYRCWPGVSCRLLILVDQSRESGPELDPVGGDGEGQHVWVVAWCAQAHAVALVATSGVVVRDVLGQDHMQVPFPSDQQPGKLALSTAWRLSPLPGFLFDGSGPSLLTGRP
jgi:hypothetical protein